MQDRGPAAYLAEFIGTLVLVFAITMVVSLFIQAPPPTPPGVPQVTKPFIDWSVIGLVHIFVLFMLIQTLAVVSGAHFNPAVTVSMTALKQIKIADAGIFIVCQLAGAVLGALLTKALLTDFPNAKAIHYGATTVSDNLGGKTGLGMIAEFAGTFLLMFAIVGVAVSERGLKEWAGLAIGGTLGMAVMLMGPLTGAGFNPARSFGPALVSHTFDGAGKFLLVYVLAPVLGALAASFVYLFTFTERGKKAPGGIGPVG